jgi:hypothetical protein
VGQREEGEVGFIAPPLEMTARWLRLSYELTVSLVLWARVPEPAGLAVAVAVASGAAATVSE